MLKIAEKKGSTSDGEGEFQDFRILRESQAADTPTRTGDRWQRRAEKLSGEGNRANTNRFISKGAAKN